VKLHTFPPVNYNGREQSIRRYWSATPFGNDSEWSIKGVEVLIAEYKNGEFWIEACEFENPSRYGPYTSIEAAHTAVVLMKD
jgi:hypothetical protein